MNKIDWKRKLTSRKFWVAIAGIVVGLVVAFGGELEAVETIAGSVVSMVSMIAYIFAEAKVDAAKAYTSNFLEANEANTDESK